MVKYLDKHLVMRMAAMWVVCLVAVKVDKKAVKLVEWLDDL